MNQIIKQTRPLGTSAGVLLPKLWLNKQVVVTIKNPDKKTISKDVLNTLIEKNLLSEVKGIYLVGSYARNEYDANSDIDILVITKNTDKLLNEKNYELTLISEKKFSKNFQTSLYKLLAVREAVTIMNRELLEKYKDVKHRLNINTIAREIISITKINKETAEICKQSLKTVPDAIIYSIVLRLRELYLIKNLMANNNPTKKVFLTFLNKGVYSAYLRIKRNEREINNVLPDDALKAIKLIEGWLKELKD